MGGIWPLDPSPPVRGQHPYLPLLLFLGPHVGILPPPHPPTHTLKFNCELEGGCREKFSAATSDPCSGRINGGRGPQEQVPPNPLCPCAALTQEECTHSQRKGGGHASLGEGGA